MTQKKSGYYYEEFEIGTEFLSQGRTITETDIINFASFTGDWAEIHTNKEYAADTPFGQRIAHGMLTLSVSSGLSVMTGAIVDTIIAFEGIENWKFLRPVFIGDTIFVRLKVIHKEVQKLIKNKKAGRVKLEATVINQKQKKLQQGIWTFLAKMQNETY